MAVTAGDYRDVPRLAKGAARRAWKVLRANWHLGVTAFGGPPVHFRIVSYLPPLHVDCENTGSTVHVRHLHTGCGFIASQHTPAYHHTGCPSAAHQHQLGCTSMPVSHLFCSTRRIFFFFKLAGGGPKESEKKPGRDVPIHFLTLKWE